MINICRKAFFYEQLKLGKGSFFEVPLKSLVYVYETIKSEKINWLHFGPLTKAGHPRHPSRLNYQWGFDSYDLNSYILSRVSMPNKLRPSSKTLAVNPQSASRELRAGSSAFNTVT